MSNALPPLPPFQPPTRAPREYSTLHAMVKCLSGDVWRDVAQHWRGIGLFYIILLELISWLPGILQVQAGYSRFVRDQAGAIVRQMPNITVTNGVVHVAATQPYQITDPKTGKVLAVTDTTDTVKNIPDGAFVLLTKSAAIFRKSPTEVRTYDLSHVKSFSLDAEGVNSWINFLGKLIIPVGYPLCVVFGVIGRLLLMLIFAALGMAFVSAYDARLSYAAVMRLAAVTMTPIIIANTILGLLNLDLGCAWLLLELGTSVTLLSLAVKANRAPTAAPGGFEAMWPPPPAPPV